MVYEPQLNILVYFFIVFIGHYFRHDVDLDFEANVFLLVFFNDYNVFSLVFCSQFSCEYLCIIPVNTMRT